MLVYRVEDGLGRGPYCRWTIPPEIAYHHNSATGRPEMEVFKQLPRIEAKKT